MTSVRDHMLSCVLHCGVIFLLALTSVEAQPKRIPHVGLLVGGSPSTSGHHAHALVQGLRELGYVEGQNIVLEYRWGEGKVENLAALMADLLNAKPDVIVSSAAPAIRFAKEQATTIPIVMAGVIDPVRAGFVASLARPGGNITGLTHISPDLSGRRLELLKEMIPRLSRLGVLWNPNNLGQPTALKDMHLAAEVLKVTLISIEARNREELESVLSSIGKERLQALLEVSDPLTFFNRRLITETAANHKLPAMYSFGEWVDAGGLMSYGTSFPDLFRRAATYVDKILKRTKPADLPVEQPTKFEFVVNLKTAKQIGLTIPPNVLARADRVIR